MTDNNDTSDYTPLHAGVDTTDFTPLFDVDSGVARDFDNPTSSTASEDHGAGLQEGDESFPSADENSKLPDEPFTVEPSNAHPSPSASGAEATPPFESIRQLVWSDRRIQQLFEPLECFKVGGHSFNFLTRTRASQDPVVVKVAAREGLRLLPLDIPALPFKVRGWVPISLSLEVAGLHVVVMPLVNGDVAKDLTGSLRSDQAEVVRTQGHLALSALHQAGFCWADVAARNLMILLDGVGTVTAMTLLDLSAAIPYEEAVAAREHAQFDEIVDTLINEQVPTGASSPTWSANEGDEPHEEVGAPTEAGPREDAASREGSEDADPRPAGEVGNTVAFAGIRFDRGVDLRALADAFAMYEAPAAEFLMSPLAPNGFTHLADVSGPNRHLEWIAHVTGPGTRFDPQSLVCVVRAALYEIPVADGGSVGRGRVALGGMFVDVDELCHLGHLALQHFGASWGAAPTTPDADLAVRLFSGRFDELMPPHRDRHVTPDAMDYVGLTIRRDRSFVRHYALAEVGGDLRDVSAPRLHALVDAALVLEHFDPEACLEDLIHTDSMDPAFRAAARVIDALGGPRPPMSLRDRLRQYRRTAQARHSAEWGVHELPAPRRPRAPREPRRRRQREG